MRIFIILFLITVFNCINVEAQNRVLHLNGDSAYIELSPDIFKGLDEMTVEMWVKWKEYRDFSQPFGFGSTDNIIAVNNESIQRHLQFFIYKNGELHLNKFDYLIYNNRWMHIAMIVDRQSMKFILNGRQLIRKAVNTDLRNIFNNADAKFYIGKSQWEVNKYFKGSIDEFRVWDYARSEKQISDNIYKQLPENEDGLIALLNFENNNHTSNKVLIQRGIIKNEILPDDIKKPIIIDFRFDKRNSDSHYLKIYIANNDWYKAIDIAPQTTQYQLVMLDALENADIKVKTLSRGEIKPNISIENGMSKNLHFSTLNTSISGTLRTHDNLPFANVVVRAIKMNKNGDFSDIVESAVTNVDGYFEVTPLISGTYKLAIHLNGEIIYFSHNDNELIIVNYNQETKLDNYHISPFLKGNMVHYNEFDGVYNVVVNEVVKSIDGMLIFATNKGAYCYRGKDFAPFVKNSKIDGIEITTIYPAADSSIWFGSREHGVFKYKNNRISQYTLKQGLASNNITAISMDGENNVWVGHGLEVPNKVSIISNNSISIRQINGSMTENETNVIVTDKADRLWLGCKSGLILFENNKFNEVLPTRSVYDIYVKKDNKLLVATNSGLIELNYINKKAKTKHLTKNLNIYGFQYHQVNKVSVDKDGNIWMTTDEDVTKISNNTFNQFNINAKCILNLADGITIFGTNDGFYKYNENAVKNYTTADGLPNSDVRNLYIDNENKIYLSCEDKMAYFDGKQPAIIKQIQPDKLFVEGDAAIIEKDTKGNLWLGTNITGWAAKFFDGNTTTKIDRRWGLPSDYVFSIHCVNDSSVWLGTTNGACRIVNRNGLLSIDTLLLEQTAVKKVFSDRKGNVWFRSDTASYCFNNKTLERGNPPKTLFRAKGRNGLAKYLEYNSRNNYNYNLPQLLLRDKNGMMWFKTEGGVAMYDGNAISIINSIEGLPNSIITGIDLSNDTSVWISTNRGVARYKRSKQAPVLKVNFVEIDTIYKNYNELPHLHTGEKIHIKFYTIDYKTFTKKVQYQYRIRELDSVWRKPVKDNYFDWIPHAKGIYTLEARAIDNDLRYSAIIAIQIEVKLPWYKSWIGLIILIVAILLIGLTAWSTANYYKQRVETQRLKDEMLEQEKNKNVSLAIAKKKIETTNKKLIELDGFKQGMTSMIVHDLKNPLNAVLNISSDSNDTKTGKIHNIANQMLNLILNILDVHKSEDAKLAINRQELNIHNIVDKAVRQTQFLAENKNITIINEICPTCIVAADNSLIERVFVNLLTNAIKFSPLNKPVSLSSEEIADNHVKLKISNLGDAIPEDKLNTIFDKYTQANKRNSGKIPSTGLGLTFCKLAVEAHNGTIGVENLPNRGVLFWFTLKLKETDTSDKEYKSLTVEKTDLQLSRDDIAYLTPFKNELREYSFYEITKLKNIIGKIEPINENVTKWKEQLLIMLWNYNELEYNRLLEDVISY